MFKKPIFYAFAAAVFTALLVAWMLVDNACTVSAADQKEALLSCYRSWFAALSGWIGAGGALLAAFWVVAETRKQVQNSSAQYLATLSHQLYQEAQDTHDALVTARNAVNGIIDALENISGNNTEQVRASYSVAEELIKNWIGDLQLAASHCPATWAQNIRVAMRASSLLVGLKVTHNGPMFVNIIPAQVARIEAATARIDVGIEHFEKQMEHCDKNRKRYTEKIEPLVNEEN